MSSEEMDGSVPLSDMADTTGKGPPTEEGAEREEEREEGGEREEEEVGEDEVVRSKLAGRILVGVGQVLPSDQQQLIHHADDSSSEDSDYTPRPKVMQRGRQQSVRFRQPWWFQEPAVKRNWAVVVGTWFLVLLGIACIIAGIILEVLYHTASLEVVRGFIFVLVGAVLLVPSVYAVTHVYLAARRVGRVRFSSVWFFRD